MSDKMRAKLCSTSVKRPSTGIPVPRGKENAPPSSAAGKKVSIADAKEVARRTRIPVNRDTNRVFDAAVVSKKTPFQIHCDEKNVPSKLESRQAAAACQVHANRAFDDTFVAKKTSFRIHCDQNNVPGKRESSVNEKSAGSKKASQLIGCVKNVPGNRSDAGSAKKKVKQILVSRATVFNNTSVSKKTPIQTGFYHENIRGKCECPASDGCSSKKGIENNRETDNKSLPSRIPRRPRSCSVLPIKDTLTRKWSTPGHRGLRVTGIESLNCKVVLRANCISAKENTKRLRWGAQGGSLSTPRDGWSYMVEQSLNLGTAASGNVDPANVPTDFTKENSLSQHLVYHYEYYDALPEVELERDKRSFRLSANFLQRSVNAEQRRLVVAFLIRVGAHGRYMPFVMYQAVKLFDAVIDKMPLNAWSVQLSALASLWIALKNHQPCCRVPSATKMVSLAKDLYQGREDLLIEYEKRILLALNFNVTFADPFTLYNYHVLNCKRCIDVSEETISFLYNTGNYLIDVTLLDEYFCWHGASLLALTVAELALGLVVDVHQSNANPRWLFWRGMIFAHLPFLNERHMAKDIDQSRIILLRRLLISGKKNYGFEVVYNKYIRSKYGRISERLLERVSKVSPAESLFDP